MSYPKPLSEKSLERLYTQAGLSTEVCDFLHSLFAACANLYGAIALRDVWSVYQKLKSGAPRIHRRDLIAFSTIVRQEVSPIEFMRSKNCTRKNRTMIWIGTSYQKN